MRADVSRANEIEAMVERAHAEFGRIDILVNNALFRGAVGRRQQIWRTYPSPTSTAGIGILVKATFLTAKYTCRTCAGLGTAAS
ncbi:hypothetical protein GBAR_LOCUS30641 [Geodia barretti]|uniref:Uncharacterized protein n=1 Tax=Geodia barretti TaxID=519541 RepID=A0AA35XLV6_GEOBA|nr:hypothetical protein GBAR_LOCUS30641 [Geodia barretti]